MVTAYAHTHIHTDIHRHMYRHTDTHTVPCTCVSVWNSRQNSTF